jgi:hypothetical protein
MNENLQNLLNQITHEMKEADHLRPYKKKFKVSEDIDISELNAEQNNLKYKNIFIEQGEYIEENGETFLILTFNLDSDGYIKD